MKACFLSLLVFIIAQLSLVSCTQHNPVSKDSYSPEIRKDVARKKSFSTKGIAETQALLSNGDIILRTGNDVISSLFAQLNTHDQTYSHCGITFFEKDKWVVYHSIGGEDNPNEKLRKDPLETFISSGHNLGYGVCHYPINSMQEHRLFKIVDSFYTNGVPFDMQFDLKTDDRLYCAEMVYKAFQKTFNHNKFFTTTTHKGFTYVSTDNIFVNNMAHILCHIVY